MGNGVKFYKDLGQEDEKELRFWLKHFEDSVKNALVQKRRWKRTERKWDIEMFFIACSNIREAVVGFMNLEFFNESEPEIWRAMAKFIAYYDSSSLNDLRDESVHKDRLYNQKSKKRRTLSFNSIIHLGTPHITNNEYIYQFGIHKVGILESFEVVMRMRKDVRLVLKKRLAKYHEGEEITNGMFIWYDLGRFLK